MAEPVIVISCIRSDLTARWIEWTCRMSNGWTFRVMVYPEADTAYIKTRTGKHASLAVEMKVRQKCLDAVRKLATAQGINVGAMERPK